MPFSRGPQGQMNKFEQVPMVQELSPKTKRGLGTSGGPIFCDPSEIGDLRQGKAENFKENCLSLEYSKVILHLCNAFDLQK